MDKLIIVVVLGVLVSYLLIAALGGDPAQVVGAIVAGM